MKTVLKDKSFGVKVKKLFGVKVKKLILQKWQKFKKILFFSKCPAINLTVENLVISIMVTSSPSNAKCHHLAILYTIVDTMFSPFESPLPFPSHFYSPFCSNPLTLINPTFHPYPIHNFF